MTATAQPVVTDQPVDITPIRATKATRESPNVRLRPVRATSFDRCSQ